VLGALKCLEPVQGNVLSSLCVPVIVPQARVIVEPPMAHLHNKPSAPWTFFRGMIFIDTKQHLAKGRHLTIKRKSMSVFDS
jgi:hypothetical protein